jgi:hypothetical protein
MDCPISYYVYGLDQAYTVCCKFDDYCCRVELVQHGMVVPCSGGKTGILYLFFVKNVKS